MSRLQVQASVDERDFMVDLEVDEGSTVAVLGPNGAGKSTLLGVISGLLRPDRGRVELGDRVLIDTASGAAIPPHKRSVALLAQQALLFPHLTALDNVAFAPRSAGKRRRVAREVAMRWLKAVDAVEFADRTPHQLSGGRHSASRSRGHWRPIRNYSCSTNRWPHSMSPRHRPYGRCCAGCFVTTVVQR